MHCNLHLQLSQCTRIAKAPDSCTLIHCGQLKEIAKKRSSGMQFELKCHMPQLTGLYCLACKQWGFARDKSTVPTMLITCTFPISTLNESLFSFSITQVTTVIILYISCRLKLYRIYKTVSLDYLYETLIQSRAGDHIHFSNVPRLQCQYVRID